VVKTSVIDASWYDYPQYYDLAFREDTRPEADFIEAACRKYCEFPVRRIVEPACGSGRLVVELAARGYRMTGFDLNQAALDYLRRRLARRKLGATVFQADMAPEDGMASSSWPCGRPVDAAYSLLNTFRHLLDEASARRHLECIAASLRPGGIYIVGFHLLPLDAAEDSIERWTARRGQTQVTVTFRVLAADRRRRVEQIRVNMLVRAGQKVLRLRDEFPLRMYTAAQFRKLLRAVPSLELCDVYDFWYEIDEPLKLNDELSDAVFILRKSKLPGTM
jgi:SAM-dependent methyltransferase